MCLQLTPQSHNLQLQCLSCEYAEPEVDQIISVGKSRSPIELSTNE